LKQLAFTPCLQVCGFIVLYLRLAEIAHTTYMTQPVAHLAAPQQLAWPQLAPLAVSAALAMYVALGVHQACLPAVEELLNWRAAPSSCFSLKAHMSSSLLDIKELDLRTYRVYTDAHRMLARLATMYVQPGALDLTEALAEREQVLEQLTDIGTAAPKLWGIVAARHGLNMYTLFNSLPIAAGSSKSISELCARSVGLPQFGCSDKPGRGNTTASFNSIISAATAMRANRDNFDQCYPWEERLPPALELDRAVAIALEVNHVREQSSSSEGLLPWQQQYLDALLTFSPTSILQAFPPPPADPADWANFYHNCCPVRLGRRASTLDEPWFPSVQLPPSPPAASSAQEVAAYVSETKAQLGVSFHALAPVAAAISHRPEPWVGAPGHAAGWEVPATGAGVALPCLLDTFSISSIRETTLEHALTLKCWDIAHPHAV
jgi:hypothetical protein